MSEWLLLNANSAIVQLYHGANKLIFSEMMMLSALYYTKTLSWIFIVLAHWNNSPRIDTSLHSDTLSWFRANQSLLFLLNAAYLAEKLSGLIRLGLEPMIYHTRSEHANHYTNHAVSLWSVVCSLTLLL